MSDYEFSKKDFEAFSISIEDMFNFSFEAVIGEGINDDVARPH